MATTPEPNQILEQPERRSSYMESTSVTGALSSAVSWGAIIAGGIAAASLSLILMILGTGLGLSLTSPWSEQGLNAGSVGVSGILWISFVAIVASGAGGYLAGRLRVKWTDLHTDEVYFRDTAHGFLAWAVGTLATAALLASVTTSIVGGAARAGTTLMGETVGAVTTAGADQQLGNLGYYLDGLFRGNAVSVTAPVSSPADSQNENNSASRSEASRIMLHALQEDTLADADRDYLARLISQQSDLSQQQAEQRVDQTFAAVQDLQDSAVEAADQLRVASAALALWIVVSLLLGAFTASLAATFGGRQRDF